MKIFKREAIEDHPESKTKKKNKFYLLLIPIAVFFPTTTLIVTLTHRHLKKRKGKK